MRFYQALGEDTFNPVAGKRVTINAQMAAAESPMTRIGSATVCPRFTLQAIRIRATLAPAGSIPSLIFRTLSADFSAFGIVKASAFSVPAFF